MHSSEVKADTSSSSSSRVKFLCSHGGNILPRPSDAHLKYVGGETRVISIHRHITFPELMKKLTVTSMFKGEMILKYKLVAEDLDMLVTVKSDEDIHHMIEECDRHEHHGAPRLLRAFLFPSSPVNHHSLDQQRYINSINGMHVVHPPPRPFAAANTNFSISSACSSPRTLPETTTASCSKPSSLTRNHSSPSLCSLCCNSTTSHHQHPHQSDHYPYKTSGPEHLGKTGDRQQHMDHAPSHHHGGHTHHQEL